MTFEQEIGNRLRNLREVRGLTRRDVQYLTKGEFKESILAMYEGGSRRIPTPRLKELADFYGVSPAFLMGESATPRPDAKTYDVEAILMSDPRYSDEERNLIFQVLNIIKAKRKAEGKD